MNNANFGYDCRNNQNSAKSELIIDEINEIKYIKNTTICLTVTFQIL